MTAREFFESARDASRDAERCRSQLKSMERRLQSLGGSSLSSRVSSTPEPDKIGRRVAAYVDREAALERRMDEDYDLIDRACMVLYGDVDGRRGGLDSVKSPVWADVLWWRYLDGATWDKVSRAVSYSPRVCQSMCSQALAWIDETEFCSSLVNYG